MAPKPFAVLVTRVTSDDLLIKIHAVIDIENFRLIEGILQGYAERFIQGYGIPKSPNDILPGKMVLALRNNQFRRAEIVAINGQGKVSVDFIDIGGSATVNINDIRRVEDVAHLTVANIPQKPLAVECILFGAARHRQWSAEDLDFINCLTTKCRLQAVQMGEIHGWCLLNVLMMDTRSTLSDELIKKEFAMLVQAEQLGKILEDKYGNTNQFHTPPPGFNSLNIRSSAIPIVKPQGANIPNLSFPYSSQPVLPTPPVLNQLYKPAMMAPAANVPNYTRLPAQPGHVQQNIAHQQYRPATLPIDSEHKVHVSYVIDGVQAFTVQLKNDVNSKLQSLMAAINDATPEAFTDPLQPGTVCLGRFSEDKSLCRAVVSTVIGESANLYFVDFGNSEIVPFNEIYKIPPNFIRPECMAIRFSLANANEYALLTQEALCLFEELVQSADELLMRVTKPEVQLKQYCELFIQANGKLINVKTKILDKVKMMKPAEYQKIHFKQGNTTDVIVTFVESAIRFFVQLELNQSTLEMLMTTVADYCATAENREILYVEDVNENMAVCAQYSEDEQWYRGLITDEPDREGTVQVLFVDYGNAEKAHFSKLRIMNNEMISKFPVQAVECRLDVEADLALRPEVIDYFVDLVNGDSFVMKVMNVLPAHVLLVNLLDQNGKSITEHLVQKFTQVKETSPLSDGLSNKSAPSQGNWRNRRSSSNADGDFSAFKRGEGVRRDNIDVDETDNVRSNDHRQYPSREQGVRKFDRNDSEQSEERSWKRSGDNDGGGRPYKPREDRWNNKPDGGGYNNRDDKRGGSNWPSRDNDDGEGGRPPFKSRGDSNYQGRDNDGNSDQRSFKPREGGWNNNADGGRPFKPRPRDNDDWQSRNNDADGRRPFKPREDRYGSQDSKPFQNRDSKPWMAHDDRTDEKTDDWGASKSSNTYTSKPTNDWSNNKSSDNWNSNKGSDTWSSRKENDSYGGNRRNDRSPRNDGGSWGGKREGGFGQKNDYGGQSKWGDGGGSAAKSRDPAYAKGSQFVEIEYEAGQQLEVVVSWFINPTQFFVMAAENTQFLQLMEKVQTDYANREPLDLNSLSPGDCLVAQDKEDAIYRARFLRARPGGAVVTFVDYGNCETVKKDQAWAVSQDHCVIPIQAVCCNLHNIATIDENTPWSSIEGLEKYFGGDKYTLTFVECRQSDALKTWSVNLKTEDGEDVGELLVAAGLAVPNVFLTSEQLYDASLLRDQILAVFSGAVISSKKFYVHIDPVKVEKIRTEIAKLCETPESLIALPVKEIVVGGFCLACSEDEEYYRALILSVDQTNKTANIAYIDYGDESDVAYDTMKVLPDELCVYNAQIMECCLHDGESFEDEDAFVEAITEKDFIIKVVDVVDDILHVIVYDIEGPRLPFPAPVDEKLPALCPLPILNNDDSVTIPHITTDHVYLQRIVDETLILDLCDQLAKLYDAAEPEKVNLEPDQFYAAKSGTFDRWYRCKACNSDCQEVFYIDYGNTETLEELIALKPLDSEFCKHPMYCVGVSTDVQFTAEDLTPLIDAVQEVVFNAAFKCIAPNEWAVDLKCEKTGKTLAEFAVETNCGSEKPSETANVPPPHDAFGNWQLNEERQVQVSHVNSPNSFYIQSVDDVPKITLLQKDLQSSLTSVLPLIGPHDEILGAQNPTDGKWYRVRQAVNEEVFAIDFGFTFTNPRTKKLPKKFILDKSNYITSCSLNVQPTADAWTEETISRLRHIVSEGSKMTAKLELVKCGEKYVDLKVDETSCAQMLINDGVAKCKSHTVTISCATSLQNFYIQFLENEAIFDLVESLTEAEKWESVEPEVGEIVASQFFEDDQWYRAEIVSVQGDVIQAKFIDYGNEATCTQFRIIPPELKSLPRYTVQCSLHPLPENAEELNETFVNFTTLNQESEFSAYILKANEEPCLVMLEFNGKLIEDVLLSQQTAEALMKVQPAAADVGETVIVSHINSPSSFYVQSETAALDEVETTLGDVEATTPLTEFAVGDLVAAKFPEDELWYRARIIDTCEAETNVLFLDYGNESVVNEVRALPQEARSVPFMAKHCAFPVPAEQQQWPEVANARFSELICEGNTVFKVTIKEDGDPAVVDLQDEGINVADELATLCKADLTAPVRQATKEIVLISHANSLNSIWIQYQTPQLDEMINEMSTADTFDDLTTVEVGKLVAAQFEGDWYRAKVLSLCENNAYNVLFIDYGNDSESTSIKSLPEDLQKLAPLTKCCRLKNLPDDTDSWPPEVLQKLLEVVAEAQTFVLNELSELEEVSVASLTYCEGGEDLSQSLIKYKYELEGGQSIDADETNEVSAEGAVDEEKEAAAPSQTEEKSATVEEVKSVDSEESALFGDVPRHSQTLNAPENTPEETTHNSFPEEEAQLSEHPSNTLGLPNADAEKTQHIEEELLTTVDSAQISTSASSEHTSQKEELSTASDTLEVSPNKAELSQGQSIEIKGNPEISLKENGIEAEGECADEFVEGIEPNGSSKAIEEEIKLGVDKVIEEKPLTTKSVSDDDKSKDQQNTVTEDTGSKLEEETLVESNDKENEIETESSSLENEHHDDELPETSPVEEKDESSIPEIEERNCVDLDPPCQEQPLEKSEIKEGNGVDLDLPSEDLQLGSESISDNAFKDQQYPAEDENDDKFETPLPSPKSYDDFITPEKLDMSDESTLNSSVYEPFPPATEKTDSEDELCDSVGDADLPFEENQFQIAHIDNPSSFYLHTTSDKKRIRKIEELLRMTDVDECEIARPEIGQVAAAKINGAWLRVEVLEIDEHRGSVVKCLDYGNVSTSSVLYSLAEKLQQIPPLVHHCAFRMPEHLSNWPEKVCGIFEDEMLLNNPTMNVKVMDSVNDLKVVNLFSGAQDITAKMISMCAVEEEKQAAE